MCVKNARLGGGKETYESMFYRKLQKGNHVGKIKGFPLTKGAWCKKLKYENASVDVRRHLLSQVQKKGQDIWLPDDKRSVVYRGIKTECDEKTLFTNCSSRERENETRQIVQYLGIAADEPKRIERHIKRPDIVLPLVEIGWDEAYCRKWCEENDLLSPIYTTAIRGGCWFCHNQGVDQLRHLRKKYPEYWELLLKWDADSPVTFKADGHTVHDYDRRFMLEDLGAVPKDRTFRWSMLDEDRQIKLW